MCLVTEPCLTVCNPTDCSPPGSSVHGDSPGKNTGVGCHALLQTQGSNLCPMQWKHTLSHWTAGERPQNHKNSLQKSTVVKGHFFSKPKIFLDPERGVERWNANLLHKVFVQSDIKLSNFSTPWLTVLKY
ncbi:unnamed protein product [Rangifer tarandus platyrhynchus]|uniref:Uncharacterized protein n=2 Tax=Rangifer tarandus platyrhynchus TaxID=3082113 RepID=A0ABN8YGC3_RANTA|nr:unnamed protein product [Rangifer tarandus platyrhynchus]